jgi:ABC-2 type transport system permease protein
MMSAFVQHLAYDFRMGLRDKTQLLMNYLFPLAFFVMIGLIFTEINPTFTETLIPAMMLNAMMASTLLGLPNPIVAAREAGIFRSFKINGVPAVSIVVIPVLGSLLHIILVSTIITVCGSLFFDGVLPLNWGYFLLTSFLAAFALAGAGILIGVVSPNSRGTVLFAQMIYLPSMILGGMMMPASMLPESMGKISMLLPASHAMKAYEVLAGGASASYDPIWSLVVLGAGGLLAFGLAIYLFDWDTRNNSKRRKGFLALLAFVPYLAAALLLN